MRDFLTPRQIAIKIIELEGGYVNDPDDRGGPTKFGITLATARRWKLDLDSDGDVDASDVKLLSADHAVDVFLRDYFYRPKIHLIYDAMPALGVQVFDLQVNSGRNAVKLLQRTLNRHTDAGLDVDGLLGAKTFKALSKLPSSSTSSSTGGLDFPNVYGDARREWYFRIGDHNPSQRKYCVTKAGGKGGWIRRAEKFMSKEFWMSPGAFRKRIGGWYA